MRLECRHIIKKLGDSVVIDDLDSSSDFNVLSIIGPSGGGKTTLLKLIGGLVPPDSGSIAINGNEIPFGKPELIEHIKRVGTVFQAYNLFPHLTALQNTVLPLEKVHGINPEEAHEMALLLFDRFRLLSHVDKYPAELSGGQQQRIAIIRAAAISPRFFLFDEPTSALDPEMTSEVLDLIAELKADGKEMIIVTHNIGFAKKVADKAIFVEDGKVIEEGEAQKLLASPESAELKGFLQKVLRY